MPHTHLVAGGAYCHVMIYHTGNDAIAFTFTVLYIVAYNDIVGSITHRGDAHCRRVESISVPTNVLPRHVTFTTRIPTVRTYTPPRLLYS